MSANAAARQLQGDELAREILDRLAGEPAIRGALEALGSPGGRPVLAGLAGSAKSAALAAARLATGRGLLVLVPDADAAEHLAADLSFWLGEETVYHLPEFDSVPYAPQSPGDEGTAERLRALDALARDPGSVVVAGYPEALRLLMPRETLLALMLELRAGDRGEPRALAEALALRGYERVGVVEALGQYSLRGGIVDVFPLFDEQPVRVEYGEDRIESLRAFAPATQRSVGKLREVRIPPRREMVAPEGSGESAAAGLRALDEGRSRLLAPLAEAVGRGTHFEGMEWYAPLYYPRLDLLSDYAGPAHIVALDEPQRLAQASAEAWRHALRLCEERLNQHEFAFPPDLHLTRHEALMRALEGRSTLELHLLPAPEAPGAFNLGSHSSEPFGSNLNRVREWLRSRGGGAPRTYVLCPTRIQATRLAEALGEEAEAAVIGVGALSAGFGLRDGGLELLTDRELYGRVQRKMSLPRFRGSGPVRDVMALQRGDYVVHVLHGIGQYVGTQKVATEGGESECLIVSYAAGDRVLVPIQQLGLLEKYSAPDAPTPRLSRLGTAAWDRAKTKARKAIKDMAEELTRLYAARSARPGHAFSPDSTWQRELEATFPFEETPGQLEAVEAVKSDMESARPMDRLICGDVGYGKTEVALRAAFKAVTDGKQVAVLVPTTILAQQHYRTFSERMAAFPLKVEVLSRFRSPREQKEVAERVRRGEVDVVIGTHRLLSRDVGWRDLGLVIVDEEHRFGVTHKERLKAMRATVDVLTMTATPIPRTLHLALMGARDLTVIETPPRSRLSIHTEIVPFNQEFIGHAILREMDRGGQVFFVHNRVQSIYSMARLVQNMLPQLRVGVAHGQMSERDLERAMLDFVDRRHDVLVSTMIIESGLDMPRVNTLFVNRADRFGLAQLYQLRGRVGRSELQAFAYLLLPRDFSVTPEAEKRLAVLVECTALGSGMRLALRDLEIRGAGNVLGAEQHGFIVDVGMEMYTRLLEEAVQELRGEAPEERSDTRIDTDVSALLPDTYVDDAGERVAIYRRLIRMRGHDELAALAEELADRFGPPPDAARHLLELQKVKLLAEEAGVDEVRLQGRSLELRFRAGNAPDRGRLQRFVSKVDFPMEFAAREGLTVRIRVPEGAPRTRLSAAEKCIVGLGPRC